MSAAPLPETFPRGVTSPSTRFFGSALSACLISGPVTEPFVPSAIATRWGRRWRRRFRWSISTPSSHLAAAPRVRVVPLGRQALDREDHDRVADRDRRAALRVHPLAGLPADHTAA